MEKTISLATAAARVAVGPFHSRRQEALRFGLGPVVACDTVAGIEQPFRHAAAHHSETDKAKICHRDSKYENPKYKTTSEIKYKDK